MEKVDAVLDAIFDDHALGVAADELGRGQAKLIGQQERWLLVTEVQDAHLAERTLVSRKSHPAIQDPGGTIGAGEPGKFDAPPGRDWVSEDFLEELLGTPPQGDEGDAHLVEAMEVGVGGEGLEAEGGFAELLPILGTFGEAAGAEKVVAGGGEGQLVLAYLHTANNPEETQALLDRKVVGLAYEDVKMDDGQTTKKAKGVTKSVIKRNIAFEDYKRCLDTQKEIYRPMNIIRSHLHQIYAEEINKIALSAKDDKRHILPDGISTLAHGHYRI